MGQKFKLDHANIVAYLTSRSAGPPRILREHLRKFLETLADEPRQYLIGEAGFEAWPQQIALVAQVSLGRLSALPDDHDSLVVPPPAIEPLLGDLRSYFAHFPLYALAAGTGDRLYNAARQLARAPTYGQLLVLIPVDEPREHNFEVLDPVPAVSEALHAAPDWPGFQFWTQTGAAAFARLDDAQDLVDQLRGVMGDRALFPPLQSRLDAVLRDWGDRNPRRFRRLLHLSDLHFGTRHATENQALLDAELREVVRGVDRVVITGDLFDTPRDDYAPLFTNFKNNITHLASGREPISVTGNHDQRMLGLFGDNYKQVALIGTRKVVVDDQCEMVFACFNSAEKGSFARGRITKSQFRQVGGEYRNLTATRQDLKGYLPIVLVHHHPFSFDVPPETLVQRALATFGVREENLLKMVGADDLHRWCLDWGIKTILHGHKHKPRYIERENLTGIGCGSSLGAEGAPMSYNLLEWNAATSRWTVAFLESVNGGAFRENLTVVSPEYPTRP